MEGSEATREGPAAVERHHRARALGYLDRDAFEREVRRALRCVDRPDLLMSSPLLDTHIVASVEARTRSELGARLETLLREACAAVREAGDIRGWRALEQTYLTPAVKQLAAADAVGLSFATYRRALAAATASVIEQLWARETAGGQLRLARPPAPVPDVPHAFVREVKGALAELRARGSLPDARLEARLRRLCEMFSRSPKDTEIDRVIRATFVDGAESQRAAAARLRMPYGTYRRHLDNGLRRIAAALFTEEDSGSLTRRARRESPCSGAPGRSARP